MNYIEVKKEVWDEEYYKGMWDYLCQSDESARYSIIVGYIRRYAPRGKILDLGCGAGELWGWLTEEEKKRYVGVDISSEAIKLARQKDSECFCEGNIESFSPQEQFDIIIFNEVLYYIPNAIAVIENYFHFLTEEGTMIISMFVYPDKKDGEYKIVQQIEKQIKYTKEYYISDSVSLINNYKWKRTWNIFTLKERNEIPRKFLVEDAFKLYFRSHKVTIDEFKGIEGKEFFLQLKSGEHVFCLFFMKKHSRGTIIISHGYVRKVPYLRKFKLFYDLGFNVFVYDMKGFGRSYGKESTYGFYERYDLSECINWVKKRLGDSEIIGLYGDEIGAATSILNMRIDDRADFCIAEKIFSNLKSYLFQGKKFSIYIKLALANVRNRIINGFWYGQVAPIKEMVYICKPILIISDESDQSDEKIKEFIDKMSI